MCERPSCPELARAAEVCVAAARLNPEIPVGLVTADGPVIRPTTDVGHELLKHGWCPAVSRPTASAAACLALAAVRLEHTNVIPALAMWS